MPLPIPLLLAIGSLGLRGSALFGNRNRRFNQQFYDRISPEQRPVIENLMKLIGEQSPLFRQAGQQEGAFNTLEEPILRQFRENLIPSILGQYGASGLGSGSSAQNAQISSVLERLGSNLASQRFGRSQQALQALLGANQQILSNPFQQSYLQQPSQSLLGGLSDFTGDLAGFSSLLGS